jgi:hypothetical protein
MKKVDLIEHRIRPCVHCMFVSAPLTSESSCRLMKLSINIMPSKTTSQSFLTVSTMNVIVMVTSEARVTQTPFKVGK